MGVCASVGDATSAVSRLLSAHNWPQFKVAAARRRCRAAHYLSNRVFKDNEDYSRRSPEHGIALMPSGSRRYPTWGGLSARLNPDAYSASSRKQNLTRARFWLSFFVPL
jgi:hypothetical protein